jgi:hypothetical protein
MVTSKASFLRGILAAAAALVLMAVSQVHAQSGPYQYYSVTPCRVLDTRQPAGAYGGPALGGATTRNFSMRGVCGIPTTARALTLNVTVTQATDRSHLILWPAGTTRPTVSTINFNSTDPALANGAIVPISTSSPDLSVFNYQGTVHVILDVTGYFQ